MSPSMPSTGPCSGSPSSESGRMQVRVSAMGISAICGISSMARRQMDRTATAPPPSASRVAGANVAPSTRRPAASCRICAATTGPATLPAAMSPRVSSGTAARPPEKSTSLSGRRRRNRAGRVVTIQPRTPRTATSMPRPAARLGVSQPLARTTQPE